MAIVSETISAGGATIATPVDTRPLSPERGVEQIGNETIDGVKTFLKSPVVPNATAAEQAARNSQVAHNTGDETIAGDKSFAGSSKFGSETDYAWIDGSGRVTFFGKARLRRRIDLDIFEGVETANNPAARVLLNNPDVQGVRFNDSADKQVLTVIRVPDDFDSTGTTKLLLYWTWQDAENGNVLWKAAHVAVTPGSGEPVTAATIIDSFIASAIPAANAVKEDEVQLSASAWAAGDIVSMRIFRNATNALDTFDGGRPILLAAQVEYVANKLATTLG